VISRGVRPHTVALNMGRASCYVAHAPTVKRQMIEQPVGDAQAVIVKG
jgi:hypothetical protein